MTKTKFKKKLAVAWDRTLVRPRDRRKYSPLYYNDLLGYSRF